MIYDVIIIGGGPAGSSVATYLRQLGLQVVLFEKEAFPRDHVGESLIPYTYWRLKDQGVLDEIKKIATFKPGVNFVDTDGVHQSTWCFGKILKDESHLTFHMVRSVFDKTLLDNARKHGAEVHEKHTVKEVDLGNGSEVSVKVVDEQGEMKEVKARFLVDASGQGSFLARKLKTKIPYEGLDRVAFFNHWLNNTYDTALNQGMIKIIYLGGEKKGWLWVIPVGRNHLSIGVSASNAYVREAKARLEAEGHKNWQEAFYLNELAEAKSLDPILKDAHMEHKVLTIGDYSYYSEKKYGDNYVMVGDAGAFLDPIFSSGIFVALETAKRVAGVIKIQLGQGREAGQKAFEAEYININGGYKLIERFVRLFYTPEVLNFSHADPSNAASYDQFVNVYNVFHYLIAGDFFDNHVKYSKFLDAIKTEKVLHRSIHYIQERWDESTLQQSCDYTFDDVYGHLSADQVVSVKG